MSSLQEAFAAALAARKEPLTWPAATALQAMVLEAYRADKAKAAGPKRPAGQPSAPEVANG